MSVEADWRHIALLKKLDEGFVADRSALPSGVGPKTINEALKAGWIVRAEDPEYGVSGWKITEAGQRVLDVFTN